MDKQHDGSSPNPGGDLIRRGLRDLEQGIESIESLLVSVGAPRLRRLGFDVPDAFPSPEHRLYRLLGENHGDAAHARYNALVRRLVSFERAAASVGPPPDA
jgi:hypothetical protein